MLSPELNHRIANIFSLIRILGRWFLRKMKLQRNYGTLESLSISKMGYAASVFPLVGYSKILSPFLVSSLSGLKKMLQRIGFKDYVISFGDNYLLRSIMKVLGDKGFLPHLDGK